MKYIKGLDTLRAFAVIIVVVCHWGFPLPKCNATYFLQELFPPGSFAVDLFFVLSGFLITSILLDARSAGGKKLHIIRNFMIRRVIRIFPVYYLTLMILVWIGYPYVRQNMAWFFSYTSNILIYRNRSWNPFLHSWTLSVEEQFYLIWPWCIVYVGGKYLKYVFIAALMIGIQAMVFVAKIDHNPWGLLLTPACLEAFGIGGLYAWLSRRPWSRERFMRVITLLLPLALGLHFYWAFSSDGGHFNYLSRVANTIVSIWLIHKTIMIRSGWIKTKILDNSLLNKIGQVSYGIYLFHIPIPYLYDQFIADFSHTPALFAFFSNYYVAYFLELALLLLLSFTSYYLFERPIIHLKEWFGYSRRGSFADQPEPAPYNPI